MEQAEIVPIDGDEGQKREKSPAQWQKHWTKEMDAAQKRTRVYKRQGTEVVRRYTDGRKGNQGDRYETGKAAVSKLNLFHKNIQTLQSMLFGQKPSIDVAREHHDPDDDIARVSSVLFQRMLDAEASNTGETLSTVLKACLQDRLLPGMGTARVRYDYTVTKTTALDPATMEYVESESIASEDAPIDYVHWQDVEWGWGRTWKDIPWWGFRNYLDKEAATERFGADVANELEYKNQTEDDDKDRGFGDPDKKDNVQKAEIWEIWNKENRCVYWFAKGQDAILDHKEDPLQLDNFWPHAMPMVANLTTTLYQPKADFILAQDLYDEIDALQTRIAVITRAIKVVGVYNKASGDSVGRMLKEGAENDLIPVDNWAMFGESGGLRGNMEWFPVQDVVGVLQTLDQVQKSKIEQLYEVVGMSDIMRGGNTDQYTAQGTQAMKAKMGSITIQALQDEFARFASDLEALRAEVISKHFTPQSIVKQSNALYLPEADKVYVQPALELMQNPDIKWRINIKPESISMIDYAQIKSERTEFLMGMAQFIQSAGALVKEVPGSMPVMLEMLKWSMTGFKGADYLEGTMDQAIMMAKKAPAQGQEQGPSPEQLKLQTEQLKIQAAQQKQQGEMQKIQLKAQSDMQVQQAKIQSEIAKMNADHERDMTMEQMRSQSRLEEIARELQSSIAEIQANMDSDLTVERAQASYDIAAQDNDHDNTMTEIAAQAAGRSQEGMSTKAKLLAELLKKSAPVGALGLGVSDDSEAGVISRGGRNLIEAWHGSPHKFDKFSMDNIGTGEGAQAYGHGLYFADSEDVAKGYRESLSQGKRREILANRLTLPDEYKYESELFVNQLDTNKGDIGETLNDLQRYAKSYAQDGDTKTHNRLMEFHARVKDKYPSGGKLELEDQLGALYRTEIDVDPDTLLDWDKPLSETEGALPTVLNKMGITSDDALAAQQNFESLSGRLLEAKSGTPEYAELQAAWDIAQRDPVVKIGGIVENLRKPVGTFGYDAARKQTGETLVDALGKHSGASDTLREAGIPGIRYKDGMSRGGDGGTSNYVMFDDKPISIVERGFADPRLLAGTAGATGLMAKLIRDSQDDSTVRAPKNPKTAMLATLLRDGERAVEGSPAEFVYPSGLAPWLERLAYDEKPSKLETAMAIADFM